MSIYPPNKSQTYFRRNKETANAREILFAHLNLLTIKTAVSETYNQEVAI